MVISIIIKWGNKLKRPNTSLDQISYRGTQILTRPDFVLRPALGPSDSISLSLFLYQFCQLLLGLQWKSLEADFLSAFPHHAPVTNFALNNLPNRSRTQSQISRHLRSPFTFISPCSPSAPFPGLVLSYTTCVSSDNQVNIISESCPLLPCIWMSTRFAVICLATELNKLD